MLKEFPVTRLEFYIPRWMEILPADHWLKAAAIQKARELLNRIVRMKDAAPALAEVSDAAIRGMKLRAADLSDGTVSADVEVDDGHYYQILSDCAGLPIEGEYQLIRTLRSLAEMKREYEKVNSAVSQARMRGYGVVTPERSEIVLDEPQLVRHGQ